jgi:hypothetical protein
MFMILTLCSSPRQHYRPHHAGRTRATTSPSFAQWAPRAAILRIFLMTGAAIGITGTIAGVVLGGDLSQRRVHPPVLLLAVGDLFNPSSLPRSSRPRWTRETITCRHGAGLSFIATIFPAWRAAGSIRSRHWVRDRAARRTEGHRAALRPGRASSLSSTAPIFP